MYAKKRYRFLTMLIVCTLTVLTFPFAALADGEGLSVRLRAELEGYPVDIRSILTYWENDGKSEVQYGAPFRLERLENGVWKQVPANTRSSAGAIYAFPSWAQTVQPGETQKYVYSLSGLYDGQIKAGTYRIRTSYQLYRGPGDFDEYPVTAVFQISANPPDQSISELYRPGLESYRDITPWQVMQKTSSRIYRHPTLPHIVLTQSGRRFHLGKGDTLLDVPSLELYQANNRNYLLYSYTCGQGASLESYLSVIDLTDVREVYTSPAFSGTELGVGVEEDGSITVSSIILNRDENGQVTTSEYVADLGALLHTGGQFQYIPAG